MTLTSFKQEAQLRDRERAVEKRESAFLQRVAAHINRLQQSEGLTLQEASKRVWQGIEGD
jgi:hypothetical protein